MAIYSKGMVDKFLKEKQDSIETLTTNLNTEITNRTNADTSLNTLITNNANNITKILKVIPDSPMTPNRLVMTDSNGKTVASDVTKEQIEALTSIDTSEGSVQDQLDSKLSNYTTYLVTLEIPDTVPTDTTEPTISTVGGTAWYKKEMSNGGYYYICRYRTTNITETIKNIDCDYSVGSANLSGTDLINSLNNYGNIIGIEWKAISGSNNKYIDMKFFNRNNTTNYWFSNTASLYVKIGLYTSKG